MIRHVTFRYLISWWALVLFAFSPLFTKSCSAFSW